MIALILKLYRRRRWSLLTLRNQIRREDGLHRRFDWVGDGRPRRHDDGEIGEVGERGRRVACGLIAI